MTLIQQPVSEIDPQTEKIVRVSAAARRSRKKSLGFIIGIAVVLVWLGITSGSDESTLRLGGFGDIDVTVPARILCVLAAAACVVMALALHRLPVRDQGSPWQMVLISASVLLLVIGLITWAARGESANLSGIAEICIAASIPLIFGAAAGALCERAGSFNIAIEGEFLAAAFMAALVGTLTSNPYLGLVAGMIAAFGVGTLLALLTVRYQVNQVVAGIILVLLFTGLTGFLTAQMLDKDSSRFNSTPTMGKWDIPILSDIPVIGQALFNQSPLFYFAVLVVAGIEFMLRRTRVGLRVRSVGENPNATTASGVNAKRARFWTVAGAGAVAGAGGAYFTVGSTGQFVAGMSSGLGYVALAAVILGAWRPTQAALSALLFGFATSLATTFGLLGVNLPSSLLLMVPYLITIIVVAGVVANGKAPAAGGAMLQ